MTEEWLTCADSTPMLVFLRGKASDRKLRLFACACCRRVWQWLASHAHKAVEMAEGYADLRVTAQGLSSARSEVHTNTYLEGGEPVYDPTFWACSLSLIEEVRGAPFYSATTAASELTDEGPNFDERFQEVIKRESALQASLLRDIFGNPFRPVSLNAEWRTTTVVALAEGIYAERAFDRMPILADALQDAGCDNDDILSHCRDTALTHVRGCWVVDLMLGKE